MNKHESGQVGDSAEPGEAFQPSRRSLLAAVVAVAAAYFYFLIFAQFGFLQAVQSVVGTEDAYLRPIMAVMGLGGIAASIFVVRVYAVGRGRGLMLTGFSLSGLAAGLSLVATAPLLLFIVAGLTGVGTGLMTVTLAAMLRREVGGAKLGQCIGAGTGLAYGLCNLPPIFNAGPSGHAGWGMVACGVGLLAVLGFTQRAPQPEENGMDYRPVGIAGWVTVFFALVWLDSAAFYVIQHTPELKGGMWGGDLQLTLNAIVHAAAALLAGLLLDRRLAGWTVLGAAGLLITACVLIGAGPGELASGAFCYTVGVSCYSTALAFYPARCGRVGLAALVYAVAGWVGSALGIGVAENLGAVPPWFLLIAGALIGGVFLVRYGLGRRAQRAGLGVGLGLVIFGWPAGEVRAADKVEAGRRVYLAEGCIHCHSQYVRPGTVDAAWWGPVRPLSEALAQTPPLLGNRRQGPDLQNVALRRTREWNRAHLIAPRSLLPGSRMPSYQYLFTGNADAPGEALLDYLASLRPVGTTGTAQ